MTESTSDQVSANSGDAEHADVGAPAYAPKKKKKYSRGLKEWQRAERRMTKANRRVAKAVLAGLDSWAGKRDKSASKRKDGAVRDAWRNYAKASEKVLKESSKLPRDLFGSGMRFKVRRGLIVPGRRWW